MATRPLQSCEYTVDEHLVDASHGAVLRVIETEFGTFSIARQCVYGHPNLEHAVHAIRFALYWISPGTFPLSLDSAISGGKRVEKIVGISDVRKVRVRQENHAVVRVP